MRFEVPQFIEIEDKIFGPLTWKQFVYVAGGGGLVAVLFFFTPFIVFVLLGTPVAVITFLLSFYPVNNRPFSSFLEAAVRYFKGTKLYLSHFLLKLLESFGSINWMNHDGNIHFSLKV